MTQNDPKKGPSGQLDLTMVGALGEHLIGSVHEGEAGKDVLEPFGRELARVVVGRTHGA